MSARIYKRESGYGGAEYSALMGKPAARLMGRGGEIFSNFGRK
jgi:hypothetical protein